MNLIKTVFAVSAIALLAGCANQQCCDDTTGAETQKDGCCAAGAKDGKSCCSEAGKCEDKKTEKAAEQKN